jgi:hypothetical protein
MTEHFGSRGEEETAYEFNWQIWKEEARLEA